LVVSRLSCQLQVHFNFCFLQGIFVAWQTSKTSNSNCSI
jgi:hypothetical protein